MIISHSRKFIFVKTLKTAGTSLEMALSKHCTDGDVLTPLIPDEERLRREVAGIGAQNFYRGLEEYDLRGKLKYLLLGRRAFKFGEHMPAWQIRRQVGEEVWNSYYKFTVVRDPFDRCVSRYYYTKKYFDDAKEVEVWDRNSFDQFLRYHAELINENWRMYTEKDRVIMDFVIRYEDLERDLATVSRSIGLEHSIFEDMKGIRAKGDYRPKTARARDLRDLFEERHRRLISILCRKEMETFGYGGGSSRSAMGAHEGASLESFG